MKKFFWGLGVLIRLLFSGCLILQDVISSNQKEGSMKESQKISQILHDKIQWAGHEEVNFILIRPQEFKGDTQYPLFVFIHGRGADPEQMLKRYHAVWTQQNFFILIPQGIYSYESGFSWYDRKEGVQFERDLEKDENIVTELVNRIKTDYAVDASKIYLGGFSQGGRLAFFIGFRNPELFRGIMPVGGVFMEPELSPCISDALSLHVDIFHGTKDSIYGFERMKAAYEQLKQSRVPVTLTRYPLGHEYTAEILTQVLGRVE